MLDASAVLALAKSEVGSGEVVRHLGDAVISAVNYSEVLHGLMRVGIPIDIGAKLVETLRIVVVPFDSSDAATVAGFEATGAEYGLSLGDRACLATASRMKCPAVTADRAWIDLDLGVEVVSIR